MATNTEPIFLRKPFFVSRRIQTGFIVPLVVGALQPLEVYLADEAADGAIITDLWLQPMGILSAGTFLRLYVMGPNAGNLLSEVAIAAAPSSPLARQDLTASLPRVLTPTVTNAPGKKEALYLAPGQSLAVGLSADLAVPIAVCVQGGAY